jgi:pimeloyl-ACP methyl ester carboxylesterase
MRKITPRVQNIYAEALDLPGCGNNSDINPLNSYEEMIDFYTQYVKDLRARAPNRPFVAIGFCYSSGFLIEVSRRNPGLIDGLILTGLIVPERELGLQFAIGVESKMYEIGTLIKNPAVQTRADAAYGSLPWARADQPTGTTPTLMLVGENDPFQSGDARAVFRGWARKNPAHLKYLEVRGGGHGVLGPIEGHPKSFVTVLSEVNQLIRRIQK